MKDSRKSIIFFLVAIFCISSVICFACILLLGLRAVEYSREPRQEHYVTDFGSSFEELWSRSDIVLANIFGPVIFAENNTIYFFGKTKPSDVDGIIALSSSDSDKIIWHRKLGFFHNPSDFFANSSGLYTGTAGDPEITAYDLQTGEIKWITVLLEPRVRGMSSLYETDGKVYVGSSVGFILDSETGEILAKGRVLIPSKAKEPFLPRLFGDIVFKDGHTISYYWVPGSSKIYAIDHNNDMDLWVAENAASNPVLFNEIIYYLTTNGELVGVNADTGELLRSLQFDSPSPGEIAVDQSTGVIYVWLQDSNQLFAFKIVEQ